MRRFAITFALIALCVPAHGAKTWSFDLRARTGDRFDYNRTDSAVMTITNASKKFEVRIAELFKAKETIDLATSGRIDRFRRAYSTHRKDEQFFGLADEPVGKTGKGVYDGVTLKLERKDGHFVQHRLQDGKETPWTVDPKRGFVMGRDTLPPRPLAVGATQTITDERRLAAVFGKFATSGFDAPLVFVFEKIETKGKERLATVTGTAKMRALVPVPEQEDVPVAITMELTSVYNLTHHYLQESRVSGVGKGSREGFEFEIRFDSTTKRTAIR